MQLCGGILSILLRLERLSPGLPGSSLSLPALLLPRSVFYLISASALHTPQRLHSDNLCTLVENHFLLLTEIGSLFLHVSDAGGLSRTMLHACRLEITLRWGGGSLFKSSYRFITEVNITTSLYIGATSNFVWQIKPLAIQYLKRFCQDLETICWAFCNVPRRRARNFPAFLHLPF